MVDDTNVSGRCADWAALEAADALLRHQGIPQARQHLARGIALRALGFESAADSDFESAFRLGSSDPAVLDVLLAAHLGPSLRAAAARAALADDRCSRSIVGRAAAVLLDQGRDPLLWARRDGSLSTGWVMSRGSFPPRVWAESADGTRLPIDIDRAPTVGEARELLHWRVRDHAVHGRIRAVHAVSAAGVAEKFSLPAADPCPAAVRRSPSSVRAPIAAPSGAEPAVTIVIPVYGDPDSLSACLASIKGQAMPDLSVIVVDDASPSAEVSRLALTFCRGIRRLYLRNRTNQGFAASVNAALARAGDADVLLLNSDVVLPERAVQRLRSAAHRAPDIGIASPLSNDVGNASFPDPLMPHPALPPAEAFRLDRAAERANPDIIVDLPSIHGSCLYWRRDCVARVGPLSTAYGRGYFEDVDLCLAAREAGFRVVAACDTYVSHHSGRSFGRDRYPLIVRNIGVLERRFPGHAAEDAAHDRADPLRRARAAIEEVAPLLDGPAILLIGRTSTRGALLSHRARRASRDGAAALTLSWSISGEGTTCSLVSDAARGPRSLAFPLDAAGLARLGLYLGALSIARIEICEVDAVPVRLAAWLSAANVATPTVVLDGVSAIEACRATAAVASRRPGSAAPILLATDAMARASAASLIGDPAVVEVEPGGAGTTVARGFGPGSTPTDPPGKLPPAVRLRSGRSHGTRRQLGTIRLGVPLPQSCSDADRLLLALARRLHREPAARLLVFGASALAARLAGPGTCWVSGRMDLGEIPDALDHHGVDRLLLPYRGSHHWVLESVRGRGRPAAFFDWSPSGLPSTPGDLALPPSEGLDATTVRLLAWLSVDTLGGVL